MNDNALKAIAKTDTELRVGNYLVLFGNEKQRDLEGIASPRKNADGSTGEYFTKATAFDSSYTEIDIVAVDWEHGMAPDGEPGPDDVLGRVDWKTARIDEMGLFVERVLNRRNQYVQYIEDLIEAGLIGNSSEAVAGDVEKGDNGEIKRWPIRRDTLTVSPMEPRMITQNAIQAIKALSERYPSLKSLLPADVESNVEADSPEAGLQPADTVTEDQTARRIEIELSIIEIGEG